jgi:Tfp pilus assembly protein FimV
MYRHVKDTRDIQARVFFKDLLHDSVELQKQMASAQQQQRKWQKLVALKTMSSQVLAGELDEQLREMTALTAKLHNVQSNIDAASNKLEECRITRMP